MGRLPPPGEMPGQGELEEVEGHVNVVRSEAQLCSQSYDLLTSILQSDLARLPT